MHNPRILIAAGGTGGHVYPAIAIASALKEQNPDTEILFVGTKNHMEWNAVPKAGFEIVNVWISGFQRRFTLKNLLFPIKLITSIFQSFSILNSFKPQVVVSCGGYVAGPVGWVAAKKNISLVIQEQNSFPGVTNRMLAKYASKIFIAFKAASTFFPNSEIIETGNPTRNSLTAVEKEVGLKAFDFDSTKPVLLVLGGSLGARSINNAVKANLTALASVQLIWQCGSQYYDTLSSEIDLNAYPNVRLLPYIENMPEAYAASDLIVSRAGASSCSELMLTGKPSVLIPSPNVAGDHQTQNAKAMVEAGASVLLIDAHATRSLPSVVHTLLHDQRKLSAMTKAALKHAKPDAAKQIANEILELAKSRLN